MESEKSGKNRLKNPLKTPSIRLSSLRASHTSAWKCSLNTGSLKYEL